MNVFFGYLGLWNPVINLDVAGMIVTPSFWASRGHVALSMILGKGIDLRGSSWHRRCIWMVSLPKCR